MASLQEQLLKAGLGDKSSAKQARAAKRKKQKTKKTAAPVLDENQQAIQASLEQKKARDRELNKEKQQELEKRAIAAQVKQLVESNRLTDIAGDITLNFTDGSTIKRMQVSETIHRAVTKGRLAVARYLDGYALIAMPVAEKLMQRDDGVVVYFAQVDENDEVTATSEEDDWYADYEIPDDLMW